MSSDRSKEGKNGENISFDLPYRTLGYGIYKQPEYKMATSADEDSEKLHKVH